MSRLALLPIVLLAAWLPSVRVRAQEASCRACHPGATRALEPTPHRRLLHDPATAATACASCHGDLADHAASHRRPAERAAVRAAPVAPAACASCHPGRDLQPVAAAHGPATAVPAGQPAPTLPPDAFAQDAHALAEVAAQERRTDFDWSGFVLGGYRLAHVVGNRDRYATDVDLEPGFRLRDGELRGEGGGQAFASLLQLQARGLGDPRWSVDARAERAQRWSLHGGYDRDHIRYRSSGEWHRVDRSAGVAAYDVDVAIRGDAHAFATFARRSDRGFWLTQRIGERNLPVQTSIDGVASPRRFHGDDAEAGLRGSTDGWQWLLAGSYRNDDQNDRWRYTEPATANPAFLASEDFGSASTLRGPGLRLGLGRDTGPLVFDLRGRYVDVDRKIVGSGVGSGFDIARYDTTSTAVAAGAARTWVFDGDATLELDDAFAIVGDLHWRDHRERLDLEQIDVTSYPTLATTTTVATRRQQVTADRMLDGSLGLEWRALPELDLRAGYGFAREWLRVPDLVTGDDDFVRGLRQDDGVLAGATWRPGKAWTGKASLRDFGQSGVALHELTPDRTRSVEGSFGWRGDTTFATLFGRHRRAENPISRHHLESGSVGITAGVTRKNLELAGSYVFARTDLRTLTNFWFDGDPTPQATFVGFDGDTHTVTASLTARPSGATTFTLAAAWTTTSGTFDVDLLDWRADLQQRVGDGGAFGVEFHQVRYDDETGIDDYGAELLFLYWRQSW